MIFADPGDGERFVENPSSFKLCPPSEALRHVETIEAVEAVEIWEGQNISEFKGLIP